MNIVLSFFVSIFLSLAVGAHEGPAYPILVDRKIDNFKLSIWTDPDTNRGTFSFYLEGEKIPNLTIDVAASPVDDLAHVITGRAELVDQGDGRSSYKVVLPVDRNLVWNIHFSLKNQNSLISSFVLPVEVTPPGPNRLEFALYFLPFLLMGFIWMKVVIAKRKASQGTYAK